MNSTNKNTKKAVLVIFLLIGIVFFSIFTYKNSTLSTNTVNDSQDFGVPVKTKNTYQEKKRLSVSDEYSKQEQSTSEQGIMRGAAAKEKILSQLMVLKNNSRYYPDTPAEAYKKHIESAKTGNIDSQYMIYKIFKDCQLYAPNREEVYKKTVEKLPSESASLNYEFYKSLKEYCRPLHDDIDEHNRTYAELQKTLQEAGHPVLLAKKLSSIFTASTEQSGSSDRPITQNSLGLGNASHRKVFLDALKEDPQESYQNISRYLGNSHSHLTLEREAWKYLGCAARFGFDACQSEYNRQLLGKKKFRPHEIDEFYRLGGEYLQFIKNEQWDLILINL